MGFSFSFTTDLQDSAILHEMLWFMNPHLSSFTKHSTGLRSKTPNIFGYITIYVCHSRKFTKYLYEYSHEPYIHFHSRNITVGSLDFTKPGFHETSFIFIHDPGTNAGRTLWNCRVRHSLRTGLWMNMNELNMFSSLMNSKHCFLGGCIMHHAGPKQHL